MTEPEPVTIPRHIVDDFLLGRVRQDVIRRFTPNVDVVSDVWRVLLSTFASPSAS